MQRTDLVCLCELYDLKEMYEAAFRRLPPLDRLCFGPHEVEDPSQIRHALAFSPGRQAFDPFPNLALVSSMGAGVDALAQTSGPEAGGGRLASDRFRNKRR